MLHDLRNALRSLGKDGATSVVAVLVTGLSLGAVTTIFSLVDTALLHPLPYDEPHRLVEIRGLESARIALAHVDVNLYRSVWDCCAFIYERLVPAGFLVFDDYGYPTWFKLP